MVQSKRGKAFALGLSAAGLLLGQWAGAQVVRDPVDELAARTRVSHKLVTTQDTRIVEEARGVELSAAAERGWDDFASRLGTEWTSYVDGQTGDVVYAEGAGIPWIPGRGNSLSAADLGRRVGPGGAIDLATMERLARGYLPEVAEMLGLAGRDLALDLGRSGQPAPHVWFVDFDVRLGGVAIEGARVVFTVNNGNLISVGTENMPARGAVKPAANVSRDAAYAILGEYVGGFGLWDSFVDRGTYRLFPGTSADASGRVLTGVWEFAFRRETMVGTWRGRVDAETGEVLEFVDANEYGSVTGGVYQGDRPAAEVVLPLPFANVATSTYTNSAGIFSGTSGTTTLNGQYVMVSDTCGSISKAADGSGNIAMGSSSGTDCTTPGSGGSGNTHAARSQFYALNRAKEVARGWLPSNTWLNAKLTANVNINDTCNAYWNGSSVNFFRSGGGCANTGELPGVSLHEYGHGFDTNDGSGSSPDNGTGETYGDFTAALATHNSCIGNGFLGSTNCGGYGNTCTACSGVRDIDWAKHTRNTASTVANFTSPTCPQPSANNPNYVGPCGKDAIARSQTTKKREGHCESYVSSEALWDLAARDMTSPGSGAAWAIVDRLWYLSRSTASAAFSCNVSAATWTSNGCNTGSLFKIFRAVDDDNGNLADGTPHGGSIYAAFNRHGIACTTDAGASTTFAAVTPPAVPSLTATAGNNSASLSWSGSSGVYDVYRNETGCNAGFTKVANDVASASYNDGAVANGFTYYYQVAAHPSGNEAAASAPSTCRSVTPVAGPCTPPAAPTGLSATAVSSSQINVSWTASSGATLYTISRSTASGGPYSSVGTSATTSFSNTGLAASTTYYYVASASNGTCSSGNSAQASATTQSGPSTVLTNGVPVTGISGATASQQTWTMAVPSGATNLQFQISGGTGDADMYVRFGAAPTTSTYDCRPYLGGNAETCTFATPSVGTYYVMLNGYAAYSGVSLVGSYTVGGGCTTVAESESNNTTATADPLVAPCSTVNGTFSTDTNQNDYFSMTLPAGSTVTALLNNLTVDYDLYIYRAGSTTAVASSTAGGTTAETATWTNTTGASTTIYARVYRYSATRTTYTLKVSY